MQQSSIEQATLALTNYVKQKFENEGKSLDKGFFRTVVPITSPFYQLVLNLLQSTNSSAYCNIYNGNKEAVNRSRQPFYAFSPWHWAAIAGATSTIQYMLEKDNSLLELSTYLTFFGPNATALSLAIYFGQPETVECLLEKANVSVIDTPIIGNMPLINYIIAHYSYQENYVKVISLLLNKYDYQKIQLFSYYVRERKLSLVDYILENHNKALYKELITSNHCIELSPNQRLLTAALIADYAETISNRSEKEDYIQCILSQINQAMEEGADINVRDPRQNTALHLALYAPDAIIRRLLQLGIDSQARNKEGLVASHWTGTSNWTRGHRESRIISDQQQHLNQLISEQPRLREQFQNLNDQLLIAINNRDQAQMESLVNQGVLLPKSIAFIKLREDAFDDFAHLIWLKPELLTNRNSEGDTPLLWATKNSKQAGIQKIFACAKALRITEIDAKDRQGDTALLWAVKNNKFGLIRELFVCSKNFAIPLDTNAKDSKGDTAFLWAVKNNKIELIKILFNYTKEFSILFDVNVKDANGDSALHWALKNKPGLAEELFTELFACADGVHVFIDTECVDREGRKPLEIAVSKNQAILAKILLEHGAIAHSPELQDKLVNTLKLNPFACAQEHQQRISFNQASQQQRLNKQNDVIINISDELNVTSQAIVSQTEMIHGSYIMMAGLLNWTLSSLHYLCQKAGISFERLIRDNPPPMLESDCSSTQLRIASASASNPQSVVQNAVIRHGQNRNTLFPQANLSRNNGNNNNNNANHQNESTQNSIQVTRQGWEELNRKVESQGVQLFALQQQVATLQQAQHTEPTTNIHGLTRSNP